MELTYCEQEQRFLPDRYVEGTCPYCGYDGARGDQCDNCGRTLDPIDLIDPRCRFDGSTPERRESEHFFLRLSAYNEKLKAWLGDGQGALAPPRAQLLARRAQRGPEGPRHHARPRLGRADPARRLRRASASTSGSRTSSATCRRRRSGRRSRARRRPGATSGRTRRAKIYYFIGKDNIWFHTLSWPAHGHDATAASTSPTTCRPTSTSTSAAARPARAAARRPSCRTTSSATTPTRCATTSARSCRRPTTASSAKTTSSAATTTSWSRTWGNLVNRVLTITYRNFDGKVPDPGDLRDADQALLDAGDAALACRRREPRAPATSARACAPRWPTPRRRTATSTRRSPGRRARATRRPPRAPSTPPSAPSRR